MKYEVSLAPCVEEDLEEAFRWIAKDSPQNAIRWYNGCLAAVGSLADFPSRCALAPETDAFAIEIRQRLYGRYRILFTIRKHTVHVLHVRHSARQPVDLSDSE